MEKERENKQIGIDIDMYLILLPSCETVFDLL